MEHFKVLARGYRSLGIGIKVAITAALIASAAILSWPYQVLPLVAAVTLASTTHSLSRGEARFAASMAVSVSIFTLLAYPDLTTGLPAAASMMTRVVVVSLTCVTFARNTSPREMTALFERVGLGRLGFTFGLALNLTAKLRYELPMTYESMLMRGWFRRGNFMASLGVFTRNALLTLLTKADDIACAAEARGFREPGVPQARQLHPHAEVKPIAQS